MAVLAANDGGAIYNLASFDNTITTDYDSLY